MVKPEVDVGDTALSLLDGDELGLDVGAESLDGGNVLVTLAFDEAEGLSGLSELALGTLVEFGDGEKLLLRECVRLARLHEVMWVKTMLTSHGGKVSLSPDAVGYLLAESRRI